MAGILELTFTGVGVIDETFDYTGGGDTFTWKSTRRTGKQVTVATTVQGIAQQVKEFYNSFLLDFNLSDAYTVTYDSTTVTLEHPDNTHFDSFVDGTHNNTTFITTAKSTTTQKTATVVTSTYSAHTSDYCTNVAVNLSFNQTINELTVKQGSNPVVTVYDNASFDNTTIDLVLERNKPRVEVITKVDGFDAETHVEFCPKPLIIEEVIVDENAVGGAVTIVVDSEMTGFSLNEYAILTTATDEDPEYQPSNTFYQLTPGDYFAVVRDGYSCVKTEAFSISEQAVNKYLVPLNIAISPKISVPFLERDLVTNALTANQYQFLPIERPGTGGKAENWTAVFAESQDIQQQWLSSFPDHNFKIVPCTGFAVDAEEITIPEILYSDNIQRDTYLEGEVFFNATYGRLAVSFVPGDEYDSSGAVIGSHTYDDVLPNFYEVGMLLIIDGEAMTITDIIEDTGKEYAITDSFTNNPSSSETIQSVHTAQLYEVWGLVIDLATYVDTTFHFKLETLSNTGSVVKTFQSYKVKVISDAEFSAGQYHVCKFYSDTSDEEIVYSSSYPVALNYKTTRNIEYYKYLKPIPKSDIQTEKLDNENVKIDSDSQEVYETNFKAVPIQYAYTLARCFNDTDYVEIDNVIYATIGQAEIDERGAWGVVKVQLASNGNASSLETFVNARTPGGYYPVKTS